MPWWAWLAAALLLGGLLYWLLVITEGAYLGPGVVRTLYDLYAPRYDAIKEFDAADEAFHLAKPVARLLTAVQQQGADWPPPAPLLLDVATGTGRLPLALLDHLQGRCQVVALDPSLAMLRQAQHKLAPWPSVVFLQHAAVPLPFADGQFDAVSCLEALEFMPDSRLALVEMLRVLRPGGVLVTTNRIGWRARLMPGKIRKATDLAALLHELGATAVQVRSWQVEYDLVLARKPGGQAPAGPAAWAEIVRCPRCQAQAWQAAAEWLICQRCGRRLVGEGGVWRFV